MKTYFNLIIGLFLILFLVSSCERDVQEQVLTVVSSPSGVGVDNTDPFECTEANAKDVAFTFDWKAADFGPNISSVYTLLFDLKGGDFSSPVQFVAGAQINEKSILSGDLNTIMHALGLPIDTETELDVKVMAKPLVVGTADPVLPVAISADRTTIIVSSYVRPGIHMMGSMFDEYFNNDKFFWSNSNYQYIMFRDNPLDIVDVCTAHVLDFTGNGLRGEMAFIEDVKLNTWTTLNKDIEGKLKYGGSNIKLEGEGYKTIKVNLAKMTYSIENYDASGATNYSSVKLIGAGVTSDVMMTQTHYDPHIWIADNVVLSVYQVKFNLDGELWANDVYPWGRAVKNGSAINVTTAGKYFVKYNDLTGHYVFYKRNN